jgi:hypothetical protein
MASWIVSVLVDRHSPGRRMVQAEQFVGGLTFSL